MPTTYRGQACTYTRGTLLAGMGSNSFTYDADGLRLSKNNTNYTYIGGKLMQEVGTRRISFGWGSDGIMGIECNDTSYFFRKNAFGDVTHIYDESGTLHAKYIYDAWGNHKVVDANGNEIIDANNIGNINPIRYRGYYYDTETGLYYLKARYYDPETGRFITQDNVSYLVPDHVMGLNLYLYCVNNPVMNVDPTGCIFIFSLLISMGISALIGGTFSGVKAYNSGERGLDLFADICGGIIYGAAIGATIALGGATGLAATGATVIGFNLSAGLAFGISVGATAIAGMAKYSLDCVASESNNWDLAGFVLSGIQGAIQGAATFKVASIGGNSGWFNKLSNFKTPDVFFAKYGGMNTLRAIAWASKVAVGETIAKAIFVSLPAAIIRWLIDVLIPDLS